jgi:hypothetical protein
MADEQSSQITPTPIPPGPRKNVQASTMLLHEWAQMQVWDSPPVYELRLGPTVMSTNGLPLTPKLENMLRVANRYADLVGPSQGRLLVVEAKVVADTAALGQLEGYRSLVPTTPALQQYRSLPIVAVLLCAVRDSLVDQMAQQKAIAVDVYSPAWIQEYLTAKYYKRRFVASDSEGNPT